jgi:DNA-binding PadR family transcriptional regulator
MPLAHALLGLLEEEPRHGYELKHRYDERFAAERPLAFGQIYATLSRLQRDGLVDIAAVESRAGPERKLYLITSAGVADLERWLEEPQPPSPQGRNVLFTKVVLALMSGRSADAILDGQRATHLTRMRALTERRRDADLVEALACDHELFHLEADLRWIENAGKRLAMSTGRKGSP